MRIAKSAVLLCLLCSALRADEVKVESKVESIGLFKNGLAVVERSVDLKGAGDYRIENVPTPVHGTFFVESASAVTVRATTMLVDVPLDLARAPLQDQLAGKKVSISLRENGKPVSGTVSQIEPADKNAWSRAYENASAMSDGYMYFRSASGQMTPASRFLVIDTDVGRTLVEQSMIATIEVAGETKTAKQRKPVLVLTLPAGAPQQKVRISYLTKGMAWAPSYRVELLDDKKLSIGQNAIIKNELGDLKDVEVFLISGYPSIDFAHVTSPLALTQTWSSFFQQLSARPGTEGGAAMRQQAIAMNSLDNRMGEGAPVAPPDESIDVHYESIGQQTLSEGDALALDVAKGESEYERVVEWVVPDARDENGRYYDEYRRRNEPAMFDDHAWDAVKFKNPLPFAMTTAPATFVQDVRFLGQQLSKWVNRGEETTLRITKALSIRTRASEQERQQNERDMTNVGGKTFRKVTVDGELTVRNYRKSDAKVLIKRQFSGEMISADEKPSVTLREEGIWSVNKRNQLEWTLSLKAGEEKVLKYSYTVLVYH